MSAPLAARLRPRQLAEFRGQSHLLAEGAPLERMASRGELSSLLLWGPPGVGKTTLARLLADAANAHFIRMSAVTAGVKDVREALDEARRLEQPPVLFVDEVHRFNKAQQDAFLHAVEEGVVVFMGATTENPSFEVNSALLSRLQVFRLAALDAQALQAILDLALTDRERGLGVAMEVPAELREILVEAADGDARRMLNLLDAAAALSENGRLEAAHLQSAMQQRLQRFDKGGDVFHDQISALHKSIRGTAPDAALYWCTRMLASGCDPLYVARRLVRAASEDIGNADPRALRIALDAWETYERLGSPEGELAIEQAVLYLASAPKSNAAYTASRRAREFVASHGSSEVPVHLRNAPTRLLKDLGHGAEYRYPHDEPDAYAAGVSYFPDDIAAPPRFYEPVARGLEIRIAEKLARLAERDRTRR